MPKHKDKPLVNSRKKMHSTLTLVDVGAGWGTYNTVKSVTDASTMTKGVWEGKRTASGNDDKEIRLLLKCTVHPEDRDKKRLDPPDGTLTITLNNGSTDKSTTVQVEYVNEDDAP